MQWQRGFRRERVKRLLTESGNLSPQSSLLMLLRSFTGQLWRTFLPLPHRDYPRKQSLFWPMKSLAGHWEPPLGLARSAAVSVGFFLVTGSPPEWDPFQDEKPGPCFLLVLALSKILSTFPCQTWKCRWPFLFVLPSGQRQPASCLWTFQLRTRRCLWNSKA